MFNRVLPLIVLFVALIPGAMAQEEVAPKVFPNPVAAQNAVTVQVEGEAAYAKIQLLDIRGRLVAHDGPLAAGTYFVRVLYRNGTVSVPTPLTLVAGGRRQFNLVGPAVQAAAPAASQSLAAAPEITTIPADSLGLGTVEVGASAQDTVFVRNDGDMDLTVSAAALTVGGAFSILSGAGGGVVAPGDTLEVIVQFTPGSIGAQADTLTVSSDDADEPTVEVELTGTGEAAAMPEIETSTDSLGFGDVEVGAMKRDTVVVRNIGTSTLSVSSATLAGGTAFTIESGGGAASIAPGDSVEVALLFSPVAAGAAADTLTIASDDADEPSVEVELTGNGTPPPAPEITVTPDSLGLGDVEVGMMAQDTVVVRNDGMADLTVSSIALTSGTVFTILSGSAGVIPAGDSVNVVIQFAPSSAGAQADTLTVASDDSDEPTVEVEVTGTGIAAPAPDITVSPDSLGLGDVLVGVSVQDTVTVRNDGTADLSLSSVTLTTGAAFSIVSGGTSTVLSPGDSVSVVVSFTPSSEGAQSDVLTILSDDSDEPSVEVEVTGTGVGAGEPEVTVVPDSLGFGDVTIGMFPSDTLYVRNDGTGDLTVSSVTLSGADADSYSILSGEAGGVVAAGDSLEVVVASGPILVGERLATLTIATDDADEPTVDVPLTATAISPGYTLVYILGDSQAAGKGDAETNCALRPDAGRRGWVYRRSTDDYVPVCDPSVDAVGFNGSVLPALVDDAYELHGKITLVIFYTVKGSQLTPEATPNPTYWYMGDDSTAAGESFDNARIVLKRGKRRAQELFDDNIEPLAGVQSFGGVDARKWHDEGNGDPDSTFRPRLSFFDTVLSASSITPLYFELGRAPGKPQYDPTLTIFNGVFDDEIDAERMLRYDQFVYDQFVLTGSTYDRSSWYSDKLGHLGSLGLDHLGGIIALALDP